MVKRWRANALERRKKKETWLRFATQSKIQILRLFLFLKNFVSGLSKWWA
jgi:hypothetical protein